MITILTADDHALFRTGIRHLLKTEKGFKVIEKEAESGEEAIKLVKQLKPQVVLMDLKMQGIGGLKAISMILSYAPDIKVLVLTSITQGGYPVRALKAGAMGYVLKSAPAEALIRAIKAIARGQRYLSPEISHQLAYNGATRQGNSPFDNLSRQEMQMVLNVIRGEKINAIAAQHHIQTRTVNSYRYNIFRKLGVKNDVQLTLLAVRHGLIDADADEDMTLQTDQ